ncbi:hypothetical protein [Paenibacillus hexagrammi]|uniref:Uncharacterized protein n=1 Tax=Paenibacillus hexagrammi TaxID=2908839 RepID=A0ABY3SKG7_9BACL|nr:hypothetical protein [Paenibacillus sp. YPD9-1]UJF34538.1 hypothetical protein L0M14_04970 [Paenibacillus sp. YPD9-1]
MEVNVFNQDKKSWNRKLINIYWGVIIALIPTEFLYLLSGHAEEHFILHRVIVPTLVMILITLTLEIAHRLFQDILDNYLICGAALFPLLLSLSTMT